MRRIIPCLDIQNGQTVKGVNFENLIHAGDPISLAKKYVDLGADELVFLDITATIEGRKTFVELVRTIANEISLPFAIGGGIRTVEDAREILEAGASKFSINSAAVKNPALIENCAKAFGRGKCVVAIDAKRVGDELRVVIQGGKTDTGLKLLDWALEVQKLGAHEVLLTSMDKDGTQSGFDIEMNKLVADALDIPVIASGGAGAEVAHFIELFQNTNVDAALAASIFHFDTLPVDTLKRELKAAGI
jgi:cyclase